MKKVLLAWIFNAIANCGTPYKQAEMNALVLQLMLMVLGWFNLLAALGITVWLATWVRQLYQGNCLQGQNPRQSPALDL